MAASGNYHFHTQLTKVVPAKSILTSAEILALVPTAKVISMKSLECKVSVNGGDAVTFYKDDQEAIITGDTWSFVDEAEVSIGTIVNLLP